MTDDVKKPELVNRSWLDEPALRAVFDALNGDGEEVRIVGGAVRNALLGEPISDIDMATTCVPAEAMARLEAAGFKVIATGIEHGTQTAVRGGVSFEVTTLRTDVETDGRHAQVAFGRDWREDAERRDFTMNTLSIDAEGTVHDLLGGYSDLIARDVRFVGDAETRIREDYLRAMRYFRFFAWYGGGRPDRDAMKAIVRCKEGMADLSVERIWQELKRILSAPEPARAVLWMRQAQILDAVLPENWGLDQFHWMCAAEDAAGWIADPLLRLQAMLRPVEDVASGVSGRLRLSSAERDRLLHWVGVSDQIEVFASMDDAVFAQMLYRNHVGGIRDGLCHFYAKCLAKEEGDAARILSLIGFIDDWKRPVFPVRGADLAEQGIEAGPEMGAVLSRLETAWVDSGFVLEKEALLSIL